MDKETVEVKKDLLKVKDIIKKPIRSRPYRDEVQEILNQLKGLNKKIEDIQSGLLSKKESPTKLKRKKEIIYLLKEKNKLTASKLSELLELSRTRCSEYLKEMETEGITKSEKEGRKKFYSLNF